MSILGKSDQCHLAYGWDVSRSRSLACLGQLQTKVELAVLGNLALRLVPAFHAAPGAALASSRPTHGPLGTCLCSVSGKRTRHVHTCLCMSVSSTRGAVGQSRKACLHLCSLLP